MDRLRGQGWRAGGTAVFVPRAQGMGRARASGAPLGSPCVDLQVPRALGPQAQGHRTGLTLSRLLPGRQALSSLVPPKSEPGRV